MRVYLISDCATGFVSYGWGSEFDTCPVDFDPPFLLRSMEVERDGNSPYVDIPVELVEQAKEQFVEWKDGIHIKVGSR